MMMYWRYLRGGGWPSTGGPLFSFPVSYCWLDKHSVIQITNKILENLLGELYTNIPYDLIALSVIAVFI
jgi:hypothetical protein